MRVSKKHDVRLNEILDAAECLFAAAGYEKTTVNHVLASVGIGKGTLYYYFSSKEEIAEGVIDRLLRHIAATARAAADAPAADAHAKMQKTMLALNLAESPHITLLRAMGHPANALLHQKFTVGVIETVAPIFAAVVREGVGEGLYSTAYPLESMEIVIAANQIIHNWTVMEFTPEERKPRMAAFLRMIELTLDAREGSFDFLATAYVPS